ncbi:MAG: OmpA family protein [Gammaproteobacteria bacterium]|nr:OmpA family protein [Gammaproteobacteria bacterium]
MKSSVIAYEANNILHAQKKQLDQGSKGLKVKAQLVILQLTLCEIMLSGCAIERPTPMTTVPLFSHSNPQKEVQPPVVRAYRVQPAIVYFTTDSYQITRDAKASLSKFFYQFPDRNWQHLVIEGHTDSRHDEGYNMKLAKRRTDSVKAVLTELGYPADYIVEIPKGEGQPVASNATAFSRQLNRRVEIQIN